MIHRLLHLQPEECLVLVRIEVIPVQRSLQIRQQSVRMIEDRVKYFTLRILIKQAFKQVNMRFLSLLCISIKGLPAIHDTRHASTTFWEINKLTNELKFRYSVDQFRPVIAARGQ